MDRSQAIAALYPRGASKLITSYLAGLSFAFLSRTATGLSDVVTSTSHSEADKPSPAAFTTASFRTQQRKNASKGSESAEIAARSPAVRVNVPIRSRSAILRIYSRSTPTCRSRERQIKASPCEWLTLNSMPSPISSTASLPYRPVTSGNSSGAHPVQLASNSRAADRVTTNSRYTSLSAIRSARFRSSALSSRVTLSTVSETTCRSIHQT